MSIEPLVQWLEAFAPLEGNLQQLQQRLALYRQLIALLQGPTAEVQAKLALHGPTAAVDFELPSELLPKLLLSVTQWLLVQIVTSLDDTSVSISRLCAGIQQTATNTSGQ